MSSNPMHEHATTNETHPRRGWGQEQRLEFIEFRLFWEGTLQRNDIIKRFGVSAAQASVDLAQYKIMAPANFTYDGSLKRFVATAEFSPKLGRPNADRYLAQLKAVADNIITLDDTIMGAAPALDAMPIPHRRVDADILRKLLHSIRGGLGRSVYYHSMNSKRPLPQWRDITPHALAFDGLRWHLRAYCHLEARFKDFILSRFLKLGAEVAPGATADRDEEWNTFFDVILIPNPKLSPSQQETVARDYDMKDGRLPMRVRCALLYYFNKRLRLDVADRFDDPKEAPIVVYNRAEFLAALA